MAKLKAHGAELARATLETNSPKSELTTWERTERVLMADGKLLEKLTVRFKPSPFDPEPDGRRYDYGWKLRGKIKPGWTKEQWIAHYQQKGWSVGNVPQSLAC